EWGQQSGWANDTLLSRLYGGRNGGELFYLLLDQAQTQPELLADFLELQYVILRLGFEGRYHNRADTRQAVCYQLHRILMRVSPRRPLELRHLPAVNARQVLHRFRFWMMTGMTLAVILGMTLLAGHRYYVQLQNQIEKVELYTHGEHQ
ncbi:MAG: DotU family type IV/VI secretion system protein, partial [Cytophagales bacterium]|nr:DotU family type IV/VI secretion system protein [Cytophagales bacterium]